MFLLLCALWALQDWDCCFNGVAQYQHPLLVWFSSAALCPTVKSANGFPPLHGFHEFIIRLKYFASLWVFVETIKSNTRVTNKKPDVSCSVIAFIDCSEAPEHSEGRVKSCRVPPSWLWNWDNWMLNHPFNKLHVSKGAKWGIEPRLLCFLTVPEWCVILLKGLMYPVMLLHVLRLVFPLRSNC